MTSPREHCRRFAATLVAAVLVSACTGSGAAPATPDSTAASTASEEVATTIDLDGIPAGLIRFEAFGPDGAELDYDAFTAIQTNGKGYGGFNDTLLDTRTLDVIEMLPLYDDENGQVVLDRPAGAVTLSLAWPTSLGYSTLLIDLPGPGTYNFNVIAAAAALDDLGTITLAGVDPTAWPSTYGDAVGELERALELLETDPSGAAAAGDRALDLVVRTALATQGDATVRPGLAKGVTIDRVVDDPAVWNSIADLAGDREPWARIVFDPGVPASTYRTTVEAARAAGVKVLGAILDSFAMADVSLADFEARVRDYVDTFGEIEAWEVGNEVNGNWLGDDVVAKIRSAAQYVRDNTSARTMLTLYWQLGEDTEQSSMFSWVTANVDPDLAALIDDVSVSMWVEEHPMGAAFDRVFSTLAARFPDQTILIGELGYGNEDLENIWWWGDPADLTGAGRRAVAETYLPLAFDRSWVSGGGFWWYYLDDLYPPNDLWRRIAAM